MNLYCSEIFSESVAFAENKIQVIVMANNIDTSLYTTVVPEMYGRHFADPEGPLTFYGEDFSQDKENPIDANNVKQLEANEKALEGFMNDYNNFVDQVAFRIEQVNVLFYGCEVGFLKEAKRVDPYFLWANLELGEVMSYASWGDNCYSCRKTERIYFSTFNIENKSNDELWDLILDKNKMCKTCSNSLIYCNNEIWYN